MTIGERIRDIRKEKGLTQQALGQLLGVTQSTVGQYETNQNPPKISTLQAIATALGVSLEQLVGVPDSVRAMGIDQAVVSPRGLSASEFNDFERFIESLGYYTRPEGDNYRLHKGKKSVAITPDELKALVRASRATVAALVQDLMEAATPEGAERPPEGE